MGKKARKQAYTQRLFIKKWLNYGQDICFCVGRFELLGVLCRIGIHALGFWFELWVSASEKRAVASKKTSESKQKREWWQVQKSSGKKRREWGQVKKENGGGEKKRKKRVRASKKC